MTEEGCIKNETKLQMTKLVGFVSILLFILALLLTIFGVVAFMGMKPVKVGSGKYQQNFTMAKNAAMAGVALVGGIIALMISICGCCTVKFKNPFVTCPFIICSFMMGFLCLIAGFLVIGAQSGQAIIEASCNKPNPAYSGLTGTQVAKREYGAIVDSVMCSKDLCPCDDTSGQKTLWQTKASGTYLTSYKRSWNSGVENPDRRNNNQIVKMWFSKSGTLYNNFKMCWQNKISKVPSNNNIYKNKYFKDAKKFLDQGGWAFLTDLEKNLNCAGICAVPLFYMTKPISEGPPSQDCMRAFVKELGGNTGLAVAAFLTAIVLFGVGICAIPLCSGYNKPDEEE